MERLVSHQQKLQFSPSSQYHHFFTHLQGQYPSLGKLQRKKLPLPLHPSYKCNPVLSFCSTSTTITTPTTVAGEHRPPDSTRGISYMNREVFTKLLFCWKILVCVFLLFFEIVRVLVCHARSRGFKSRFSRLNSNPRINYYKISL